MTSRRSGFALGGASLSALSFALLWVSCLAQADPSAALSDGKVKIGVLTDMSGPYSDNTGAGAVTAARMAIEDFGGKLMGRDIELVFADHQNKSDVGKAITQRWFDREGVDATFENTNSAVALAVAALGAEKKRITVVTGAATSALTNESCAPGTSVHWVWDTYAQAAVLGKSVVKGGRDTWFFITADYAFGHATERDTTTVVKSAGGRVLGTAKHPVNAGDFGSAILQAQSSKAKVIALANAGEDSINTIKAASEFGVTRSQTIVPMAIIVNNIHALGLQQTQGMLLSEAWYWNLNDETRAFAKRFAQRHNGRMPNNIQAGVYSAVGHYLKAVQAAGTDQTAKVRAKMGTLPVNDVFAKHGFLREDGRMVHDMYLFEVKKPTESKAPWDYYHLRETVPGKEAFQPLSQSRCPQLKNKLASEESMSRVG